LRQERRFERYGELVIVGSDLEQQSTLRRVGHGFGHGDELFGALPVELGLEMFVAQWSLVAVIVFDNAAMLACVPLGRRRRSVVSLVQPALAFDGESLPGFGHFQKLSAFLRVSGVLRHGAAFLGMFAVFSRFLHCLLGVA
jgi:hypothetical protein